MDHRKTRIFSLKKEELEELEEKEKEELKKELEEK